MKNQDVHRIIMAGWDSLAEEYQKHNRISTYDVHYGPLAPGEKELQLLEDVKGRRSIEIGCGGGQNTIALARWGAEAFGVDPSKNQIEYARRLAKKCEVKATFNVASAEDLRMFENDFFDIALSSFAFEYVGNLRQGFGEANRVLKKNSLFVFCLCHPLLHIINTLLGKGDEEAGLMDYLSWPRIDSWDWSYEDTKPVKMHGHSRTLSQLINALLAGGFMLERIVEQGVNEPAKKTEKELATMPYHCEWSEKEFGVAKKIPYTLIIKARKTH